MRLGLSSSCVTCGTAQGRGGAWIHGKATGACVVVAVCRMTASRVFKQRIHTPGRMYVIMGGLGGWQVPIVLRCISQR
jgi:hypothetical protein